MQNRRECDVLVVGGGPAGSTVAALLAQTGRHVVVLEKDRFPRFHIGESLLPLNLPLFERLGIADQVERIGVYKPGAEVVSDEHAHATTFRFDRNPYLSVDHSYHVRRADFDKLLLDNSRLLGAAVSEGTRVTEVEFGPEGRHIVTAVGPDGAPTPWFPRFLVDASGRDTLLLTRLGLKRVDKRNNTAAVFGHFRNVSRRSGSAAGMITMHLFRHGWFWMIPLPDDVMSVGLVGTRSFFRTRTGDLNSFFARAVAASPSVAERMTNAEPSRPLVATANYSYASRRYAGDGYILIGDAAAFIDPLFSSGVMMAMSSAAFAAEVVDAWLDNRELGRRLMRDYERRVRRALHSLSWLIYRINAPVLRDIFMASFDLFDTRNGLLAILAGDFYAAPGLLSPLRRLQPAYGCLYLLSKLESSSSSGGVSMAASAWSGELNRSDDGFSTRFQRLCHDRGSGRPSPERGAVAVYLRRVIYTPFSVTAWPLRGHPFASLNGLRSGGSAADSGRSRRSDAPRSIRMRRRGVYLAVWLAMTAICWQPRASAARNGALPPDLKPMLEHLAIVSEMMRICGHMRPDLAPQLHDAWTAWQLRNARVPEILDALRQDAAGANSEEGAPAGSGIAISPAKAREFVMAYEALRQILQYQVEDQLGTGNMKLVRNCDNVLAKFTSGRLDYHPPAK